MPTWGCRRRSLLLDLLKDRMHRGELDPGANGLLSVAFATQLSTCFRDEDRTLHHAASGTTVWLFVGVNGVGEDDNDRQARATREKSAGQRSVVLAAGDTFRAAAGEQLSLWAERSAVEIVQGADGADPSSVIYDAIQHAAARNADLVLADSAGRLHNKANLMEELKKVRRICRSGSWQRR